MSDVTVRSPSWRGVRACQGCRCVASPQNTLTSDHICVSDIATLKVVEWNSAEETMA